MQLLRVTSLLWVVAVTSAMVLPDSSLSSIAPAAGDPVSLATAASSHASSMTSAAPTFSESTLSHDLTVTNDGTASVPVMPPEWESMCDVAGLTPASRAIHCDVTSDSNWTISTYTHWAQGLDVDHVVDLEVTCSPLSSIGLHWPYRVPRLRSLTVKNCMMRDWLNDIYRLDALAGIADTLEHLHMVDNVAMVPLDSLESALLQTTAEFECGPQQLRSYRQSGNSFLFNVHEIENFNMTEDELIMLFERYIQRISVAEFDCRYTHLETYEDSHRQESHVFFTHLLKAKSQLPNLRHINLSYNTYNRVPETVSAWQQEFPSLESLNMSHNAIQGFNMRVFSFKARGHIDLTYNNLSTLGPEELESIRVMSPVHIDVRNNPYQCACPTSEFSDFLYNHDGPEGAGLDPYYAYLWDMTCQSPPELKGRRISEFSQEELCHESKDVFALFVILPVVIVLIVLYFAFRLEVDVFMFAHMGWLLRIWRKEDGQDSKAYDLYVSHSSHSDDHSFVYSDLQPRLETPTSDKPMKYKLCLEDRDFELGAPIADNILTKMADSRAVVMVLSRDMPVDGWAEFEFQEALFRAVSERRPLLVFLQRGNLDTRVLSPALRRALNLFPLIKIGERQFWNKLDYFLKRHATFPVTRSGCSCCCRKVDPEEELTEVSRMARDDRERRRQSMRNGSSTSPVPARSPTATPPFDNARDATPNDAVDTNESAPELGDGCAEGVDVTSVSAKPALSNGQCLSSPQEAEADVSIDIECADPPSLTRSTPDALESKPGQRDTKNEEKLPQGRDGCEAGVDSGDVAVFVNSAYEAEECMV